jgi:hypothetical protein
VSVVIGQDDDTHVAVIAYPSDGAAFAALRTTAGHDQACRMIPNLAPWTDPHLFDPISDVLVGGHLTNTYRLQGPALGLPPATGLYFLGDTVLTTNPAAGRNLALLLPHAQQLLACLDDPEQDLDDASLALDAWAEQHLRPWYLDHVRWDRTLLRRFDGDDIDLTERIPSDVICAAAATDPGLMPYVGMYFGMVAGPDVLDPIEDTARGLLESGWRPATPGPTGEELARAISGAGPGAAVLATAAARRAGS